MKKTILSLMIALSSMLTVKATTITVSNNTERPAQENNLQTAIDNASVGDTIYVYASPINYGSISIKKKIILIGEGYQGSVSSLSTYGTNTGTITFGSASRATNASGSFVTGIEASGSVTIDANFNSSTDVNRELLNITISNCIIRGGFIFGPNQGLVESFENIKVVNCIVDSQITFFNQLSSSSSSTLKDIYKNIVFENCFIEGIINSTIRRVDNVIVDRVNLTEITLKNCFFRQSAYTATQVLNDTYGINVVNSIFYNSNPYNTGKDFPVNISNSLLFGTNVTTSFNNNLIDVDPQFENYPLDGADFSADFDYTLKTGSPLIGAGLNGEDIGVLGGSNPFVTSPLILPRVTELSITGGNNTISQGGDLQINFSAKAGN